MKRNGSMLTRPAGGRRALNSALVVALVAHLVVLPAAPVEAGTGSGGRSGDRPEVSAEPGGAAIAETLAAARFRRIGSRHSLRGRNGIKLTTSLGRWQGDGLDVRGATVAVKSPWGEELDVDFFLNDVGLLAVFNDRIQALTVLDAGGNPHELRVTVDGRTTVSRLDNRAQLIAAGAPIPRDLDLRAHHALALAVQDELSPAFLSELGNIDRPAERTGCAAELTFCIAAIAAWAIDVALLPGACLVGGVPTFGISCALAIIGHELASAAVVRSCTDFADCREEERPPAEGVDESTPIIIDMDGRDFRLTGLDDPVRFDLTADGEPEWVSWTARGGEEAFLVLDRNGNGRIDDGSELFGSRTPLIDGSISEHGFWALTEYDLQNLGGNENGKIDAGDRMFGRLMLWTDRNHDGISSAGELRGLKAAGVVSVSLDFRVDGRHDRHGNKFVLNSRALVRVRGHVARRAVSDVYLQIRP